MVLGIAWPVIGAAVVRAQPRNPVGWLMLVPALVGPYQLAALYAAHTDGQGWLGAVAAWVAIWGFAPPYFFTLPVIPQLFPDGRPLSPRWRKVVVAVLVVACLTTLCRMVSDVHADLAPQVDEPARDRGRRLASVRHPGRLGPPVPGRHPARGAVPVPADAAGPATSSAPSSSGCSSAASSWSSASCSSSVAPATSGASRSDSAALPGRDRRRACCGTGCSTSSSR